MWSSAARSGTAETSLREVWGYVMGPPGWTPDGSRKTSRSIKQAWAAQYGAPVSSPAYAFSASVAGAGKSAAGEDAGAP